MAKGIFCLERLWFPRVETDDNHRSSVSPLLNILGMEYGIRHIRFDCGTIEEFTYRIKRSHKRGFDTLYLAYHGEKGKIKLENGMLSLEKLSSIFGRRFEGWHIHFAACSALNTDPKKIIRFKRKTGASLITGYTKDVYWINSLSLELGVFSYLIDKKPLHISYNGLIEEKGFVIY